MKYIIILMLFTSMFLGSCKKEIDLNSKRYPYLKVDLVSNDSTGINVNVDFLNNDPEFKDDEFTIIWKSASSQSDNSEFHKPITFEPDEKNKIFFIANDLEEGQYYFLSAVGTGKNYIAYANEIEFKSKSTSRPIIDSINLLSFKPGDTLLVYGENFSSMVDYNNIYFNNMRIPVIESSLQKLIVVIPSSLDSGEYQLKYLNNAISIIYQELISISTYKFVPYFNVVSLSGSNFNFNSELTITLDKSFEMINECKVLIGDILLTPQVLSNSQLKVNLNDIPLNLQKDMNVEVKVVFDNYVVSATEKIYISNVWKIMGLNPFYSYPWAKTITIQGVGYLVYNNSIYKFIEETGGVELYTQFKCGKRNNSIAFGSKDKIYIGGGSNAVYPFEALVDIWEFNPLINDQSGWTRLPDIQTGTTFESGFVLNDSTYLITQLPDSSRSFLKYNSLDNNWEEIDGMYKIENYESVKIIQDIDCQKVYSYTDEYLYCYYDSVRSWYPLKNSTYNDQYFVFDNQPYKIDGNCNLFRLGSNYLWEIQDDIPLCTVGNIYLNVILFDKSFYLGVNYYSSLNSCMKSDNTLFKFNPIQSGIK